MTAVWVYNSSPLIALGHLELLPSLSSIQAEYLVPTAVRDELLVGPEGDPAKRLMEASSIEKHVTEVDEHRAVLAADLGKGETAVLSLAMRDTERYHAILDDRAARRFAAANGFFVTGTVGVLLVAKKRKVIGSVGSCLGQLRGLGIRLSPELVSTALTLAGESDA